ncbi:unnamed protein product (macronuclear) [Paramecium tetraurelia]|uniref:Uncharacterized protein n=1 Tax=Paramecium tetraurelia TaxID=5888 RepID=A0DE67_PARTE|nr:uncharacterized protein GSPATT00016176001 [Paramecium tetraurelia]CAK81334.1 unnamed protein product [Paramecium tetraurelia]|eukprot:XP_001448731.1 hypothetical protein (macronuclear) [Paramecium tetraurelia strain d4-2]
MYSFLTNQLIFDLQLTQQNNYWNMYQNMQQIYYPYVYGYPYVNQPQIYHQLQEQFPVQPEQGNKSYNNLAQLKEDASTCQGTRRSLLEMKDVVPVVSSETLEKYILLIVNEDDAVNQIISSLKNSGQFSLSNVLEILSQKQKQQHKSREELIKFCLRKAFKFIFRKVQEENDKSKTNLKSAQKIFIEVIEQETKKSIILPFRKNSKNKTMNTDFLKEIFSSPTFVRYYEQYLSCLDEQIQKDTRKKIAALCNKIQNKISDDKIFSFEVKRLPWTLSNIEKVKLTAKEMLLYSKNQYN